MTFIELGQFAGAIGLGAIVTKLLDALWLHKALERNENRKWLREQRLRVYSELAKELMAMGKHKGTREDAFKGYGFVAEALLLVESPELGKKLEQFFTQLSNLYDKGQMEKPDVPEEELQQAYLMVYENSRKLVAELRKSLQEK